MSRTVPIEQVSGPLEELIRQLLPGEEITLTAGNRPIAKILPQSPVRRRQAGTCKGMLTILSEDDEHLADFKDYM